MKTKTLLWILGVWLLSLAIMMLVSGCRTKTVTEYVSVHDTLRVTQTDTLVKVRTEFSHDTLRIETERIITITEKGETLKVVEWRDRWRDRVVQLTDTIREKATDTVYVSKDSDHDKVTVKRKSILKPVLVTAFLALMIALIFLIYKRK